MPLTTKHGTRWKLLTRSVMCRPRAMDYPAMASTPQPVRPTLECTCKHNLYGTYSQLSRVSPHWLVRKNPLFVPGLNRLPTPNTDAHIDTVGGAQTILACDIQRVYSDFPSPRKACRRRHFATRHVTGVFKRLLSDFANALWLFQRTALFIFPHFSPRSGLLVHRSLDDVIACPATWAGHLGLLECMCLGLRVAILTLKPSEIPPSPAGVRAVPQSRLTQRRHPYQKRPHTNVVD